MPAAVYEVDHLKGTKLRYIWILSNERATFPVGGVLFLPQPGSPRFHLVTFNVGNLEDGVCRNDHHAEMQAIRWIKEQPRSWQARMRSLSIINLSRKSGLGYSPCNACCEDLAKFRRGRPFNYASILWLTRYDKNKACGHPTDAGNLARLRTSGWRLAGPGWPPVSAR
jgi:hypothetical protein